MNNFLRKPRRNLPERPADPAGEDQLPLPFVALAAWAMSF
jgi:hypothetical protein